MFLQRQRLLNWVRCSINITWLWLPSFIAERSDKSKSTTCALHTRVSYPLVRNCTSVPQFAVTLHWLRILTMATAICSIVSLTGAHRYARLEAATHTVRHPEQSTYAFYRVHMHFTEYTCTLYLYWHIFCRILIEHQKAIATFCVGPSWNTTLDYVLIGSDLYHVIFRSRFDLVYRARPVSARYAVRSWCPSLRAPIQDAPWRGTERHLHSNRRTDTHRHHHGENHTLKLLTVLSIQCVLDL